MIRVKTAVIVHAPVATVRDVYADYSHWPQVFPTIKGVRLVAQHGMTAVLEVDHVEGHVINELTVTGNEIRLWEVKRHYDALFVNQLHAIGEGTPFIVQGEIHLKGAARLLRPFLGRFVRQQMERWQLQPVKAAAEARSASVTPAIRPMRGRRVRQHAEFMTTSNNPKTTAALHIGPVDYRGVGAGPTVVFLHGVLMAGDVWQPVADQLSDSFRCIMPTLPLGAHRTAVRPDADLSLDGFGHLVLDFIEKLDLHDVMSGSFATSEWFRTYSLASELGFHNSSRLAFFFVRKTSRVSCLATLYCESLSRSKSAFVIGRELLAGISKARTFPSTRAFRSASNPNERLTGRGCRCRRMGRLQGEASSPTRIADMF
jgi:Polyketide cyclase / dehydrase and lipid transport